MLSYACRWQLIRSILSSMQNFWAHIFPLYKKIVKAVESVCRKFLWTDAVMPSKKAPIAWEIFHKSKANGGWNLTYMKIWNQAAITKLLWAIAFKREKLWVQWIHAYYIKSTLETVVVTSNTSWMMKKILAARTQVQSLGGWQAVMINGNFSIHKAYCLMKDGHQRVPWRRLIRDNKASPKSIFVLWMAVQNRLATADRLLHWNVPCNHICSLCGSIAESTEHYSLNGVTQLKFGISC